jgi:GTP cyclohydrolase II
MNDEFPVHRDKYFRERGGFARVLEIACARCGQPLLVYQKDGDGPLLRSYYNRIIHPLDLVPPAGEATGSDYAQFACPACRAGCGQTTRYKDGRLAIEYRHGAVKYRPIGGRAESAMSAPEGVRTGSTESVDQWTTIESVTAVAADGSEFTSVIEVLCCGSGPLSTPFGDFTLCLFRISDEWETYEALIAGPAPAKNPTAVPPVVRIDSGCVSGQVYRDRSCDCEYQLLRSMELIGKARNGVVIRIPAQDGRGHGLAAKLASLELQRAYGIDTVEAAGRIIDGDLDRRDYRGALATLQAVGIRPPASIRVATNNPAKIAAIRQAGYGVAEVLPVVAPRSPLLDRNLVAKREAFGHLHLDDR